MKNIFRRAVLILLCLVTLLLAQQAAAKSTPYAAKVNGQMVPLTSFERVVNELKTKWRPHEIAKLKPAEEAELKQNLRTVLDQMIDSLLIAQGAKQMGISVTDQEVKDKFEAIKKSFPAPRDFYSSLNKQNVTLPDFRAGVKDQLLRQNISTRLTADMKIPEEKVRRFFEQNKNDFPGDYDSARPRIERYLTESVAQETFKQWLNEERERSRIEYNPDLKWVVED